MPTGKVKFFDDNRGYGFIEGEDPHTNQKADLFVHFSAVESTSNGYRSLQKGQWVEYEAVYGERGLQALKVTPLAGIPKAEEQA